MLILTFQATGSARPHPVIFARKNVFQPLSLRGRCIQAECHWLHVCVNHREGVGRRGLCLISFSYTVITNASGVIHTVDASLAGGLMVLLSALAALTEFERLDLE